VLQRFKASNSMFHPVVSADGRRVAVPWTDNKGIYTVEVADARTGAPLGRVPTAAHEVAPFLSADGTVLALAVKDPAPAVQVYDLAGSAAAVGPKPPMPPMGAPGELKFRWTADVTTKIASGFVSFDADGQTVAVAGSGVPWAITAFNARTSVPHRDLTNLG